MAQSPSNNRTKGNSPPRKPIPPPMQSVIKGAWTYRVENPIETYVSALKELAEQIRTDSWAFVRYGPRMLSPFETHARQHEILALAAAVERLASEVKKRDAEAPQRVLPFPRVTEILKKLHTLGFFPNELLVANVARAAVSAEKFRGSDSIEPKEGASHA